MGRMHKSYCCVSTCRNSSYTRPDLAFFNLPADKDRRMQWLLLIGREDMLDLEAHFRYYSVCEEHFSPDSIRQTNFRKLLGLYVLPTLCLPLQQDINKRQASTVSTSASTQTGEFNSSAGTLTNQDIEIDLEKDTHMDKLHELNSSQKITALEPCSNQTLRADLDILSEVYSKPAFTELIKCDEKLTSSRTVVNRYESYRQFCLNLYYGSSQGYRILQSAVHLPNLSTMYEHIPITTEINERLLNALHVKVESMLALGKSCMVVIDSIPLTPVLRYCNKMDKIIGFHEINGTQAPVVAERALVMMIHGMFVEWQQPAGYALLSGIDNDGTLAQWINELINKLCDIGLNIRILSFASKTEADFFEERWVSIDSPCFYLKRRKIYYISDPKMLLNALRNDLSLYDVCYYDKRVAKYEHIEQFYNKDKNSQYRLAPNLTHSHVYPIDPDKADAVELFSKTVASGLSAYIDVKQIDISARDTVELIVKISDLFSLFNSSNAKNSNNRVFNGDQSHIHLLKQMKDFFANLKLIDSKNNQDVTQRAKFVKGFLMNINSYLRLSEEMSMENCTQIPIRVLNQDLTKEFFEKIKIRTNAIKPTAEQFGFAYSQLYILNAVKPLKTNNNTQDYYSNFFKRVKKAIVRQNTVELSKHVHELKNVPHFITDPPNGDNNRVPDSQYNHFDRAERHTMIYVSGYFLKKCKEYHNNCEVFKKYADGTNEKITLNHISRYLLYSQKNRISLISIPCNHFVTIIDILEDVSRRFFRKHIINCKIEQTLCEKMNILKSFKFETPPCPCFPWDYLFKLFIGLKIAYTIHLNNREIGRKRKDFVIPLLLSESNFLKL